MSADLSQERKVPGISCPPGPAQILRVINGTQGSYRPSDFFQPPKVTSGNLYIQDTYQDRLSNLTLGSCHHLYSLSQATLTSTSSKVLLTSLSALTLLGSSNLLTTSLTLLLLRRFPYSLLRYAYSLYECPLYKMVSALYASASITDVVLGSYNRLRWVGREQC